MKFNRITYKMSGFNAIRRDPALVDQIDGYAERIAKKAGRGFGWKSSIRSGNQPGSTRHRAIVATDSPRAKVVNARDNTLLKVLGGM